MPDASRRGVDPCIGVTVGVRATGFEVFALPYRPARPRDTWPSFGVVIKTDDPTGCRFVLCSGGRAANPLNGGTMQEISLPNGAPMFHLHAGECLFLYEEIFNRRRYAAHGIGFESPAGCIIDVGANIGMASYFFHCEAPGNPLFAVEPSPRTFPVLSANLVRLGARAKLFPCALSKSPGFAAFVHYPQKSSLSGLFPDLPRDRHASRTYAMNEGMTHEDADAALDCAFRGSETYRCPLRTLSSLIEEHDLERIELLKIDVERAELDVLMGIRPEHWSMIRQVIVEVHDDGNRLEHVSRMLRDAGFRLIVEQDVKLRGTELHDVYARRA